MKLGLGLDLYRAATLEVPVERVQLVESLGYHSVWTAEAYGCDAMTPLRSVLGYRSRIKLATGVMISMTSRVIPITRSSCKAPPIPNSTRVPSQRHASIDSTFSDVRPYKIEWTPAALFPMHPPTVACLAVDGSGAKKSPASRR